MGTTAVMCSRVYWQQWFNIVYIHFTVFLLGFWFFWLNFFMSLMIKWLLKSLQSNFWNSKKTNRNSVASHGNNISLAYAHGLRRQRGIRCLHNVHLCTSDGLAFGQDGDCSLCHLLLLHHRRDLWAPAVRAHPDKMTCLVGLFRCVEQPPAKVRKQMLPWIRPASQPTPLWYCCAIDYTVVWWNHTETAAFPHVCMPSAVLVFF